MGEKSWWSGWLLIKAFDEAGEAAKLHTPFNGANSLLANDDDHHHSE